MAVRLVAEEIGISHWDFYSLLEGERGLKKAPQGFTMSTLYIPCIPKKEKKEKKKKKKWTRNCLGNEGRKEGILSFTHVFSEALDEQ